MKTRRITAMLIAFIMVTGLFAGIEVFATGPIITHFFDPVDGEIITISIDVMQTGDGIYGIEFSSPKDLNTPMNIANLTPYGMLRICNDQVLFRTNGGWIAPNQLTQAGINSVPFTQNEWHNIKLRVTRSERLAELYLDEEYAGSMNLLSELPNPAHLVRVFSQGEKNFEMNFVSATASAKGEMSGRIDSHDPEKKEISVTFSEAPKNAGTLGRTALRAVNTADGEHNVSLTVLESNGSVAKFGYKDKLKLSTEYALIFPEGIIGKNNGLLKERYLYFTTDTAMVTKVEGSCDYENGEAGVYVEQPNGVNSIVETEDGHGKAFYVRTRKNTDDNLPISGFTVPTADSSAISIDIQPRKANLKLALEAGSSASSAAPISIVFAENGSILCRRGFADSSVFAENDAYKGDIIGSYEANKWYSFKVTYNKSTKRAEIYLNGRLAKTLDENAMSGFNQFGGLRYVVPAQGNVRTGLFYMDNIKSEIQTIAPAVTEARFNSALGDVQGGAETISRLIESVDVKFVSDMADSTLGVNTVKLFYNGVAVDYTGEYNKSEKMYTLYPKTAPVADADIFLSVNGAEDEMIPFEMSAKADASEDGLQVFETGFIDAEGKKLEALDGSKAYAKTVVANLTDEEKEILVSLMGYQDSALKKFDYKSETLPANSVYIINEEHNTIEFSPAVIDRAMITVQDGATKLPMTELCELKAEGALETGSIEVKGEATGDTVIEIYAPEKSFSDMENADDFRDVLIYKTQLFADDEYEHSFNIAYNKAESGMYTVEVYNEGSSDSYKLLYVNEGNAKNIFDTVFKPEIDNKDADKAGEILLENHFDLYVDDRYIDEAVADRAAELIIKSGVTFEKAETVVNKAVAIAAFEEGKIDNILEEDEIFNLEDSEIAELYNASFVREATVEDITKRMESEEFDSAEDFDEKLKDAFILAVVNNPAEPGCVKTVLNKFGISAKKDKAYSAVSGKDYDTVADLEKALDKADDSGSTGGGSSSGGGGGRGSSSAMARDLTTPAEETQKPAEKVYFTDLTDVEWAKEAINALAEKSIINGKYDKHFCPDDYITREEFTKIIVSALNIKGSADIQFSDVESGAWYYDFISRAYGAGVVNGYDDGRFGVGDCITRQDMAVMIYRSATGAGIDFESAEKGNAFTDDSDISDYAKTAVYALRNSKVINGREAGKFAPEAFATRAEAAKMIYGILGK